MTGFYIIVTILVFFAAALPVSILSVIWDEISVNLTVGVPYVAILRALIVLGAAVACILCEKLKERQYVLDLVVIAVCMEALSLIGFSLSRVFWNLALWAVVLGAGMGMSLTLLCMAVVRLSTARVMLLFTGSAAGVFAGAFLLDRGIRSGHSWRTSCQFLAIFQILLSLLLFLILRMAIRKKHSVRFLEERRREYLRRRESDRKEQTGQDAGAEDRIEQNYLLRMGAAYLAAGLTGFLLLAGALWPQNYLVTVSEAGITDSSFTVYGILLTAAGVLCGRAAAAAARLRSGLLHAICSSLLILVLLLELILQRDSIPSQTVLFACQFLTGAALGPVFPQLILIDDVRLDRDAENSFTSLLPAFYLSSILVITPVSRALAGSGSAGHFALWMLAGAVVLAGALLAVSKTLPRESR